jgi:hypothetical protein
MTKSDKAQTKGRAENAAEPLGERSGLVSSKGAKKTGKASLRKAGPDGPDANAVSRMTTGT